MRIAVLCSGCLILAEGVTAAPVTYVHPSDPTCMGSSPCYDNPSDAILAVDNGGTVIIQASMLAAILNAHGRVGVTLRGLTDMVEVQGQILFTEVVEDWTIRDLRLTAACQITDVEGSVTIDNLTASNIKLGPFTRDQTADIVVRNSTLTLGSVNVVGDAGFSLGGTILIEDNEGLAVNINVEVAPGAPTTMDADIVIQRNTLHQGGGVRVLGNLSSGTGFLNGSVEFSENTIDLGVGKIFGVVLAGNVTGGEITAAITYRGNDAPWLAAITYSSTGGGSMSGPITIVDNLVEAFEFRTVQGGISGPIVVSNNRIIDRGGATGLDNPLLLIDGGTIGDVTVDNNTAPEADLVVRSTEQEFAGRAVIVNNHAGLLTLDSRAGDFLQPFVVAHNTLPTSTDPRLAGITIRTMSGGDLPGGQISENLADELTVNIGGNLTGNLRTWRNTIREVTAFIGGTPPGVEHVVEANDFGGLTRFNGIDSTVHFNRFGGDVTVIQGTDVDASLNWWGCNEGPGTVDCSDNLTQGFVLSPWLVMDARLHCQPGRAVASFDVFEASDGSTPVHNKTPGTAQVTSPSGTVLMSPVSVVEGQGCAEIDLAGGASTAEVTVQIDGESITRTQCSPTPPPQCLLVKRSAFEGGLDWDGTLP